MKINKLELGNGCFGPILRINDVEYEDLDKKEVIQFIVDYLNDDNNINNKYFLDEMFREIIEDYVVSKLDIKKEDIKQFFASV